MDIYKYIRNLYNGRINRKFYFFGILLFIIALFLTAILVFSLFTDSYSGEPTTLGSIIFLFSYIIYFILITSLYVRRFHDKGESGWHILFLLIPLINLIVVVTLLLEKGNTGDNKYGEDPLKNKKDFFDAIFNKSSNPFFLREDNSEKVNVYGYCYKCGAPIGPDSKFCSKCGTIISKK